MTAEIKTGGTSKLVLLAMAMALMLAMIGCAGGDPSYSGHGVDGLPLYSGAG